MNIDTISKAIHRFSSKASVEAMKAVVKKKKTYFSVRGRYGAGWSPLKEKTIKIKEAMPNAPFPKAKNYRTGHLMKSLRVETLDSFDTSPEGARFNLENKKFEKGLGAKDDFKLGSKSIEKDENASVDKLKNYYPEKTKIHYDHLKGDNAVYELCVIYGRDFLIYSNSEFNIAMKIFNSIFIKQWKSFVSRYGEEHIAYIISSNIQSNSKDDFHLLKKHGYRLK